MEEFQEQVELFKKSLFKNLHQRLIKDEINISQYEKYMTVAYSVVDTMIENWMNTQNLYAIKKPKRVFYLSMEYLIGRSLSNALICMGLYDIAKEALLEWGYDLEELMEQEVDAGLGNGGLGRLAACFMDSMANLGIPAHGYVLHYEY